MKTENFVFRTLKDVSEWCDAIAVSD